jgi:hypothetical protein
LFTPPTAAIVSFEIAASHLKPGALCVLADQHAIPKEISIMTDHRVLPGQAQEDQVTATIEQFTSQIPSSVYLGAALASMAVSVGYKVAKNTDMALFIGQWAAPFLILGLYNKMVKQHGSDAAVRALKAE